MFDIWNNDEEIVSEIYSKDNYCIEYKTKRDEGYCVIYCSSNHIWSPNEKKMFEKSFIKNDRYEWKKTNCKLAIKEIYIRDIYKSWYVTGINNRLDSIDGLINFLMDETAGYSVIVIGSSSGGYLASLVGSKLSAEYIIAFSAQFELRNRWAMGSNPFLKKYETDYKRSCYYDLRGIIVDGKVPIYYIVPKHNKIDNYHYEYIKDIHNIKVFQFGSKHHGVVMLKDNLEKFISMTEKELQRLHNLYKGKEISVFEFSIRMIGFRKTIIGYYRTFVRILLKAH